MKESLGEIFKRHSITGKGDVGCADKGTTHSYIESYERLLESYRNGCTMMEIGVALGHSIRMWDEYFDKSGIIGVDISLMFDYKSKNNNEVILWEIDATKDALLKQCGEITFDIIIDDGEHTHQSQIATFEMLKGKMNKGGIYIIEDILNWDISKEFLMGIHSNIEVIDLRHVKGRFDDVLLVYRF